MAITCKRSSSWIVCSVLAVSLMLVCSLPEQGWAQAKPAGDAKDRRILEKGKVIERELAVGEVHSYEVALTAGQYVAAGVENRG